MEHVQQGIPGDIPAENLIALEGGCNFRDMGGYEAADGRLVRRKVLYRSGVLSYLTGADQQRLAALGVVQVCDLRRVQERDSEPTHWPDERASVLSWDDARDALMVSPLSAVRTAAQARAGMLELYRNMPQWLAPRLRGLFQCLVHQRVPMVFHCAAGKDRTGLAAALILMALGVPQEAILADYAATNEAVDLEAFIAGHRRANLGLATVAHPILTVPEAARKVLFHADPDYLLAALSVVTARPGGVQAYLAEELGVTQAMQAALAEQLLM